MAENVKVENKTYNDEPKAKAVFKLGISRSLIRDYGHKVVDIKPNRVDKSQIVVFFEDSLKLRDDMQKIVKRRREMYAERNNGGEAEKPQQED